LINFVPGISKKGPVNNPIYVESKSEFISIFGDIDKGLERKGSFFHRTCIKMLESGPIYALNLLLTDDNRDKAHWKSLSCAQDFWERDSESFLEYVNDPTVDYNRLLHLTNFGNKVTTTFIYKSKITGFDITAEDWYGGKTKVPAYINSKDWISDYLVSVLILDGDWTNYNDLTEDKTWGKYFSSTGLNKTTIQNFVNEPNVTTLAYYDASLIPYFRDINDRDMYIKTLINNDTNKTGLFCAYFEDELLDSDFPIGKIDLIGDGLLDSDKKNAKSIEFLSYKEDIVEELIYEEQLLDSCGNVFGNYDSELSTSFVSGADRTAICTNGYVSGTRFGITGQTLIQMEEIVSASGDTYFKNSTITNMPLVQQVLAENQAVSFSNSFDVINANQTYYIKNVSDGGRMFTISNTIGGTPIIIGLGTLTDMYVQRTEFNLNYANPYFIIDNTKYNISAKTEHTLTPFTYTVTPDINLERYDILYLTKGNETEVNVITGSQSTTGAAKPPFILNTNENIILGYFHLSHYQLSGSIPSAAKTAIKIDYYPITIDDSGYITLSDATITSGSTTNNYIRITFANTSGATDLTNYTQIRYRTAYNEIESKLSDGKGVIINHTDASKYSITQLNMSTVDYNSMLNAYIQIDIGSITPTEFYNTESQWLVYFVDNEFVLNNTSTDRMITSLLSVNNLVGSGQTTTTNAGVIGKYSNIYLDYYNGIINNGDFAYTNNDTGSTEKFMLKAWFQDNDKLYIDFMGEDNISPFQILNFDDVNTYNKKLIFTSANSNFKQTVEIEDFDMTKYPHNVYTIKVDAVRYSELIKGEMIEAYYDESELEISQDARKLTRIIQVLGDPSNSNLKVVTCDSPIKINVYDKVGGGYDYQTTTYPTIEKYVSDYKGIKLTPFTISNESIPNGTEERQSNILDLLLPTTNLGQGLINKNKIQWRYLIDSFGLGLTSKSKQQYSELLGKKLNSFGFISAPSVKTFKSSVNPSFINDDHTLNTEYLKTGGNEYKNPSFLYSFAEGIGRSTIGYFFPYVRVNGDIPTNVPPAAWVASTYMKKFLTTSSAIQPWTIAAGISNGRVTDIGGVEMDFSNDDLANLYSMGLNPIVKKKDAGFCINSESTAQVFPYSSLSIIHAREVLIELENTLYDMLLRYQWRFNTGPIRAEIKYKADKICQNILDKDGLYDFENIIDDTNNTNYIIDLQMGVLDTRVEIVKGMGIIVNNITILKKGDIQSGGFKA